MRYPLLLLLFPVSVHAAAVYDFNDNCKKAYALAASLDFDGAKSLIETERRLNKNNIIPDYTELQIQFLRTYISEETADFETFKKMKSRLYERMKSAEEPDSPYPLLIKSESSFTYAVLKIKFNELITAGYEFRKSYKYIENNRIRYPDFLPNKKMAGILHALIGAVPDNYKWIVNLLGFKGTIAGGLEEIESLYNATLTHTEWSYMKDELLFIIGFLKAHLLNNPSLALSQGELLARSVSNPLHLFAAASIFSYNGKNDRIIGLLEGRTFLPGRFRILYLEYLLGVALLNKADSNAITHFDTYINNYKGISFIRAAHQKAGWSELIHGDTIAYRHRMKKIMQTKGDFTDEDKQALAEAESGLLPNAMLLRARVLFDGGYYADALRILAKLNTKELRTSKDQVEYIYRLARIYDRLNEREKALRFYMETIRLGKNQTWYFAANSALLTGLIYEREGDFKRAEHYFRLCLDMRGHEYQNSIDQKARAGVNRIKNQQN